ncbi:MAG: hypothetical protein HY083_07460, partial [Gammaproteobacteria bacterium]|nr:hypothetical protein [Gammaproteobacteria bacterium]
MTDKNTLAALMLGALLILPAVVFANPPSPVGVDAEDAGVAPISAADIIRHGKPERLGLRSRVALVWDDREGVPLYGRSIDEPRSIASL